MIVPTHEQPINLCPNPLYSLLNHQEERGDKCYDLHAIISKKKAAPKTLAYMVKEYGSSVSTVI
jgi:hypothetical protein